MELTYEDILGINLTVCEKSNQTSLVINEDNIRSAIGNTQWYNTPEEQASALLRSLIIGHGFQDGNKRTAVLAMIMICKPNVSEDDIYDVTIAIAKGLLKDVEDITLLLYGR